MPRRVMGVRVTVGLGMLIAIVVTSAAASFAQPASGQTAPAALERGKQTFQQSCAVCHGDRGNGKGPASAALTPRPTDLTLLTKQRGAFPAAHVEGSIRGTDPVVAHGNSAMMVWGAVFLADANGNQAVADARIHDLVTFIGSIQK